MTTPKVSDGSPAELTGVQTGTLTESGAGKAIIGKQSAGECGTEVTIEDILEFWTFIGVFSITDQDTTAVPVMTAEAPMVRDQWNAVNVIANADTLDRHDGFHRPWCESPTTGNKQAYEAPLHSQVPAFMLGRHFDGDCTLNFRVIKPEVVQGRLRIVYEPVDPNISGQTDRMTAPDKGRRQTSEILELKGLEEFDVIFQSHGKSGSRPTTARVSQYQEGDDNYVFHIQELEPEQQRFMGQIKIYIDQMLNIPILYPQKILLEVKYRIARVSLVNPKAVGGFPSVLEARYTQGVHANLPVVWTTQFGQENLG